MKDYLNEAERDDMINLFGSQLTTRRTADGWLERGHITKEEARSLRQASTLIEKVFYAIFGRLKPGQDKLIMDRAERFDRLGADQYAVSRDSLDKLIEGALASVCSPCTYGHDRRCPWRACFKEFHAPMFDSKANGKGQCQYEHTTGQIMQAMPALPCDQVRVRLEDGKEISGYIECISGDKKGWMALVKAGGRSEWYDFREFGVRVFRKGR